MESILSRGIAGESCREAREWNPIWCQQTIACASDTCATGSELGNPVANLGEDRWGKGEKAIRTKRYVHHITHAVFEKSNGRCFARSMRCRSAVGIEEELRWTSLSLSLFLFPLPFLNSSPLPFSTPWEFLTVARRSCACFSENRFRTPQNLWFVPVFFLFLRDFGRNFLLVLRSRRSDNLASWPADFPVKCVLQFDHLCDNCDFHYCLLRVRLSLL